MCFVFLFYWPVVKVSGVSSAKNENSLYYWMVDAQSAGYLNGSEIDVYNGFANGWPYNFDHLTYNSSKEGALEFYNRLWDPDYEEYDGNYYFCEEKNGTDIDGGWDIPQPNNFTLYDLDLFTCDDTNQVNDAVCTPTPEDLLNGPMTTTTEDPVVLSGDTNYCFKFVLVFIIVVIFMFV